MMRRSTVGALVAFFSVLVIGHAKEEPCEVCVAVLRKVVEETPDKDRSDMTKLNEKIRELCGGMRGKENKFCFYIGALPESATSIMNEATKPLSWSMPVEKVCERLREKDAQICDLKFDKEIDWKTVDLAKLRVKELKKILDDWGEHCKACTEKVEFVSRIKELMPKYVKIEL